MKIRAEEIKKIALVFWAIGLTFVAVDFLSIPILQWRASIAYLPFSLSFLFLIWAEKREFSTRGFLYRLHDVLIFSSWRYLLLFFLWISIFSPFTDNPTASIIYSINGWLSFFAVGISAHFLFCEVTPSSTFLLKSRLNFVFQIYSLSLILLFLNLLIPVIFSFSFPLLVNEKENLFLYFVMGFPFLLWDFSKAGRRMLPKWMSLFTILIGVASILLFGRKFFSFIIFVSTSGLISLYLYKQMRSRRLILALSAVLLSAVLAALIGAFLKSSEIGQWGLQKIRIEIDQKLTSGVIPTWEALLKTGFMGKGIANTEVKGLWFKILSEAGVVGALFFGAFFLSLLVQLFKIRKSGRVVVSNIAFVSLLVFISLISNYVENPYGAYIWVWLAIFAVFSSTEKKNLAIK